MKIRSLLSAVMLLAFVVCAACYEPALAGSKTKKVTASHFATVHLYKEKKTVADQIPSVGRVVHYLSYGTPNGEYESTCRAAIVTEVYDPGNPNGDVGLCVLNPTGQFFNRHVRYGNAPDALPGTWHWPERV